MTRDITERREAEEQERLLVREQAARERATDILESISDAFYAVDKEWRFTYINGKAEELWGRSREELLGKNVWEEFPEAEDPEFYRQIRRAMERGVTTELETESPVLGTWVAGRAYPSREGLSVYFRDITERKRARRRNAFSSRRAPCSPPPSIITRPSPAWPVSRCPRWPTGARSTSSKRTAN